MFYIRGQCALSVGGLCYSRSIPSLCGAAVCECVHAPVLPESLPTQPGTSDSARGPWFADSCSIFL